MGADVLLVIGNRGLFDGVNDEQRGSDAEFASLAHIPTALVINASGYGPSISAAIKGFTDCSTSFPLAASILNEVPMCEDLDERKQMFTRAIVERGLEPPLGIVPNFETDVSLPERSISQKVNDTSLPRQFYLQASELVANHIDIDRVIAVAQQAPKVQMPEFNLEYASRRARIAVTDDGCFNLCFQDNLDLLRHFGAELKTFSPLADESLPRNTGAVYVTGAFLGGYARDLEKNSSIKESLRDFVAGGGVLYSEGAGTAYLCRSYVDPKTGDVVEGVGILPGEAVPTDRLLEKKDMETLEESILGGPELFLRVVDVGDWGLKPNERILRTVSILPGVNGNPKGDLEGFSPSAQTFCTFSFPHFGSNPQIAKNIVDAAEVFKKI
jgi:cobyrinic acid a,c-diamide synthase